MVFTVWRVAAVLHVLEILPELEDVMVIIRAQQPMPWALDWLKAFNPQREL